MTGTSIETAMHLANCAMAEYQEAEGMIEGELVPLAFGDWVLKKYYPDLLEFDDHYELQNMVKTRRTSDARTYLIGFLQSGRLSTAPLALHFPMCA